MLHARVLKYSSFTASRGQLLYIMRDYTAEREREQTNRDIFARPLRLIIKLRCAQWLALQIRHLRNVTLAKLLGIMSRARAKMTVASFYISAARGRAFLPNCYNQPRTLRDYLNNYATHIFGGRGGGVGTNIAYRDDARINCRPKLRNIPPRCFPAQFTGHERIKNEYPTVICYSVLPAPFLSLLSLRRLPPPPKFGALRHENANIVAPRRSKRYSL